MSAMHWEARRRQQVLDHRLSARVKQEGKQDKNEESASPNAPCESAASSKSLSKAVQNNSLKNTLKNSSLLHTIKNIVTALEVDKQCICKCHAEMNKKYTSLQYSQQC